MGDKECLEKVRCYVIDKLAKRKNCDHVGDNDDLIESGIVDSLGVMQLIGYLEETFSIHVEDAEVIPDNFQSVSSISIYVSSKV